jgi:hypothetical protein
MLNLSPTQEKHLEAVEWLFYGPLAAGRTHLLATIALKRAIDNPGYWVRVFGHEHGVAFIGLDTLEEIERVFCTLSLGARYRLNTMSCDMTIQVEEV